MKFAKHTYPTIQDEFVNHSSLDESDYERSNLPTNIVSEAHSIQIDTTKGKNRFHKIVSRRNKDQFSAFLLLSILLFCGVTTWLVKANAIHNSNIQTGIAKEIIRFHVIANSDSTQDQALKLKVKDQLVESLSPLLGDTETITDARTVLASKLDVIQEIAENTIKQYGYSYSVKVTLQKCNFPLKVYGKYTFPPGEYEALRVQIGAAEGKNWWCVMFPPLCFVDETYSIVDERTNKKIKHLLTEEEYDTLVNQKKPVKIKFKIWESIKDFFD